MSSALGALIAHVTFWILLAWGWISGDVGVRARAVFVVLWVGGLTILTYFVPLGPELFASWVALLDVALVVIVFKGDVRLS